MYIAERVRYYWQVKCGAAVRRVSVNTRTESRAQPLAHRLRVASGVRLSVATITIIVFLRGSV